MSKKRGILLSFEGVEGTGKSTQTRRLCKYLKNKGIKYTVLREPGSSVLGEQIRHILLYSKGKLSNFAETLLFIAARDQLRRQKIDAALEEKDVVILDRYADATIAYQGYGSGVDLKLIRELNKIAMGAAIPDVTILFDIDPGIGLVRSGRNDRFEKRKLAFHERVRQGYLRIAKENPKRIKIINAKEDVVCVQDKVRVILLNALKSTKSR
ncbi:MAG: dTMP kinase [Candidatus Omnitrophica bacterium]|nr:dTMP kinase [Candidatus Omnitrophota bacterium]